VTFWSLVGLELMVIGMAGPDVRWLWLILLTLPAFVWWLSKQQRDLKRIIAVFLDKVAEELKLAKVGETRSPAAAVASNAAPPAAPVRVVGGATK